MEHHIPTPSQRTIAAGELLILVGVAAFIALPGSWWITGQVAMIVGTVAVIPCAVLRLARTPARRNTILVAAISTMGLLGAIAYLQSLDDEPSAIPLAGVGVLMLSLLGLMATTAMLWTDHSRYQPRR